MRDSASLLPNPDATVTPRLHKADLHLLAVFMTVAQYGGFAAAQVALNVSQSTISRNVGDLERGLGMRLCQRGRAGFHLTDKGRVHPHRLGATNRTRARQHKMGSDPPPAPA